MKKTWTKIEDYVTTADLDERDCVYPICLIEVEEFRACEHACPFERAKAKPKLDHSGWPEHIRKNIHPK